jgi:hypothetical protein
LTIIAFLALSLKFVGLNVDYSKGLSNMNRFIVAIGLIVAAGFNAFSQGIGTLEFMNVGVTADRQIYVGDYLGPVKAAGDSYQIALFWGPSGSEENALLQLGNPTGFLDSPGDGQFSGGLRTIFGVSEDGAVVALQARAWDKSTGATWAEAAADPAGRVGKGPVFEMKTKDPNDIIEQAPRVGYAPGWRGFAIAVPEPSTLAFAALGTAGLLLLRRRR